MNRTRHLGALLVLSAILKASAAFAIPQAPHDVSNGVTCLDCHVRPADYGDPAHTDQGTTTGGTELSAVDSSKSWAPDAWVGGAIVFTSGPFANKAREIIRNTADTVWWKRGELDSPVTPGTTYQITKVTQADIETKCRSCHRPGGQAATLSDVGLHTLSDGRVIGCGKCHDPHNVEPNTGVGQALIRRAIRWPTVTTSVAYPSGGNNRFIAGASSYDGVCEVCHTSAAKHRNNASGDHDHYTSWACTDCHAHGNGFQPACGACHGIPPAPADEEYTGGGGAHPRHVTDLGYGCDACHLSAPHNEVQGQNVLRENVQVAFSPVSFPAGTTTENGGSPSEADGTCFVGCHNPVVASPLETPNLDNAVSWTQGVISCASCHDTQGRVMGRGTVNGVVYRSGHPYSAVAADARTDCQRCHDQTGHRLGSVVVTPQGGPSFTVTGSGPSELEPLCRGCHDGSGASLAGGAPLDVVTPYSSPSGDFHGTRAGTGWGGTLRPPYTRGSGPVACATCHDQHGSPHAYDFATEINGRAVSTPISRSGVGAEQVCTACHDGVYHQGCANCHGADPIPPPQPCFYCHTHNGVGGWLNPDTDCDHCHVSWYPWGLGADTTAPLILSGPTAIVGGTWARVVWTTNEGSSSTADFSNGSFASRRDGAWGTSHEVTISGLALGTTYAYRVRSRDGARNEVVSNLFQLTTADADPPNPPALIDEPDAPGQAPAAVTVTWNVVTSPDGHPVEYHAQISAAADFSSIAAESSWVSGTVFSATLAPYTRYYWRVRARDASHPLAVSAFSTADTFLISVPPPAPALHVQGEVVEPTPATITLSWDPVVDPNGDPITYEYEVWTPWDYEEPTLSGATSGTSFNLYVSPGASYDWYVTARNTTHPWLVSPTASSSFHVNSAPPRPTLIDEGDFASLTPASVTLQWNAAPDPDGNPVRYQVQISVAADFSSVDYSSGWITGTSFTQILPEGAIYYWRVQAGDAAHPLLLSPWSNPDSFAITRAASPPAPAPVNEPDFDSGGWPTVAVTLDWSAVAAPDGDPTEYLVQVDNAFNFSSPDYVRPWQVGTTWALTVAAGNTWYWRVAARDSVHTEAQSPWSVVDAFADLYKSSCPFVYAFDGTGFVYATDIQGQVLGLPLGSAGARNARLYQSSFIVLDQLAATGGEYRINVRETLAEIDYFDVARVMVADYPEGRRLVSSSAEVTYTFGYAQPLRLTTITEPVPPAAAADRTGADVLARLGACDGSPAPVDPGALETYTLEFPAPARPEHAKLVIDGWSIYSASLRTGALVQPFVEAQGPGGAWTQIAVFGPPAGDLKTMVVDLSGRLPAGRPMLRVNLGMRSGARWVIDCVGLDDSAPAPIQTQMVDASYAELLHRGRATYAAATLEHRITALDDVQPDIVAQYGSGRFTRYGDVLPLLRAVDDEFVIMQHGDQVSLRFPAPPPPPSGTKRTVLLEADVYYKSPNREVEPLPFHGMSSYPYPATESYPTDQEHTDYLTTYNTRVVP